MKRIFAVFLTACFLCCAPVILSASDLEFEGQADRIEDENDDDMEDFIEEGIRDKQVEGGDVDQEEGEGEDRAKEKDVRLF